MDSDAIARLRELLAKATPGPWRCTDGPDGYQHRLWVDLTETTFHTVCDVRTTSDAALIAAMHEALPALLALADAVNSAPETAWMSPTGRVVMDVNVRYGGIDTTGWKRVRLVATDLTGEG